MRSRQLRQLVNQKQLNNERDVFSRKHYDNRSKLNHTKEI